MRAFRETLAKAKNIVVLTGSGVSAESGVPTFRYRGPESLWKNRCVTELATPETFQSNPSLVWEFYSHRRGIATNKAPNGAHKALAELEAQLREQNRNVTVITQNIDKLHHKAGSQNVLEMFGNLFETRCTACGHVSDNHNIPIVPSLKDKGDPDTQEQAPISVDLLPRCEGCGGLLRPHVVWYGEGMEYDTLAKIDLALRNCDLYIQVGSSSQIYPAANYGPMLVARGVPVAEFNHSTTPVTKLLDGGPSNDMKAFREVLAKAKNIVVLSGAGISAESGVPTFRGAGGYWRKYDATQLATPEAFMANPSLVWEFYSHRREVASTKVPNAGHKAVADLEKRLTDQGRNVTVVTQNIDRLHHKAGSQNIIEMHGTLFRTRCTSCGQVNDNHDIPIVPSLQGKGAPEPHVEDASIPVSDLPKCGDCSGLLRPHVVWFGEGLEMENLKKIDTALKKCDLFLLVGTSSIVYPAASYAPMLAARGVPVAEFNLKSTPVTQQLGYHFQGKCGSTLPEALAPHSSEAQTKS